MRLLDSTDKVRTSCDHGFVQLSPLRSHTQKLSHQGHLLPLLGWQFPARENATDESQLFAVTSAPHGELNTVLTHIVVQDTAKVTLDVNQHSTIICTKRDLRYGNVIRLTTPGSVSHNTEVSIGVEEAPELGTPHTIDHVGIVMPTNAHKEATRR